jgi:cyanophycinase
MTIQKFCGWLFLILLCNSIAQAKSYKYIRIGQKNDIQTKTSAGTAMMGGGSDLEEAFRWLCDKANGGDFLVLRAHGGDDYNAWVNGLCKLNSVATLVIPSRQAALDPTVADIIRHAEAVFIAGGDQSRYINFWKATPVQDAINANIVDGKPIGGTSAGLAVQGEFVYTAMNDPSDAADLSSPEVLTNPYHYRVALARDFLKVSHLQNVITDSHFAKRDRLGRSVGFLARIVQDGWSKQPREIAVDEKSAVLVEPDGKGTVVGPGMGAYFIQVTAPPELCNVGTSLTFRNISTYHAPKGAHFDLDTWNGDSGESYTLSVENGVVHSTRAGNAVY